MATRHLKRKLMPDYYQRNAGDYHQRTFFIDPSAFLEPLRKRLDPGCTVLDIGCGSGRDMLWFKNHGFSVSGFERSAGLAELARQNSGCTVIEGDFEAFSFEKSPSDAILLAGSLVHVPHEKLPLVFKRVTAGLTPGGKVLITLKQGNDTGSDEFGREFYYWRKTDLDAIFNGLGFNVLELNRQVSKVNARDVWLAYVLESRKLQGDIRNPGSQRTEDGTESRKHEIQKARNFQNYFSWFHPFVIS